MASEGPLTLTPTGTTTSQGGARARHRRRTARALQAAALELFERQGYDATGTEEIAAAADVSPRTFFRYFPTKESVVFWDDYVEPTQELLADPELEVTGPWDFLRVGLVAAMGLVLPGDADLLGARCRVIFRTPALLGHLAAEMATERRRLAEQLLARFEGLTPLAAEALAGAAVGAAVVALERWAEDGGDLLGLLDEALGAAASSGA